MANEITGIENGGRRASLRAPEQAPVKRRAAGSSGALYRATSRDDWLECEIIARHPGGFVLRETGRQMPGVWLASPAQVRVIVGTLEAPEIVRRNYLPKDATPNQIYRYRIVREAASREVALRQVFGP